MTSTLAAAAAALTLGLGSLFTTVEPVQDARPATAGQEEVAEEPTQKELDAAVVSQQLPSYPLTTCPVSGEELGSMGDAIDLVVDGRLIRVCCKGCVKPVKADAAPMITMIDAAVIAAQMPIYPLTTCPVSGEELGSMGDPIDVVVGTRLARVCCKGCVKRVQANPAQYLAPVDAALIEAQMETYGLPTCFVSSEALVEGETLDFLYGTELVRLCCKGCKRVFDRDPVAAMAKLHAARAPQTEEAPAQEPAERKG